MKFKIWFESNDMNGVIQSILQNPSDYVSYLALADMGEETNQPWTEAIREFAGFLRNANQYNNLQAYSFFRELYKTGFNQIIPAVRRIDPLRKEKILEVLPVGGNSHFLDKWGFSEDDININLTNLYTIINNEGQHLGDVGFTAKIEKSNLKISVQTEDYDFYSHDDDYYFVETQIEEQIESYLNPYYRQKYTW